MKTIMNVNYIKLSFLFVLTLNFGGNTLFAQVENHIAKDTINFVVTKKIIGNVNSTDATAAMTLAMNEISSVYSDRVKLIKSEIINNAEEIPIKIKQNKADLIGMFSLDYLKYKAVLPIEPLFILRFDTKNGKQYVVLVRNDSQINSLKDLESKKTLILDSYEKEIIERWLFVEMKKSKIKNPSETINSFIKIKKPAKALFSVFLGNSDACILSKSQFESMCELNPQLKSQMKILIQSSTYSSTYLTHVFCKNTDSKKYGLENAFEYSRKSMQTSNGKQLLKLFRAIKLIKFEDKFLDPLEELVKEYDNLVNN